MTDWLTEMTDIDVQLSWPVCTAPRRKHLTVNRLTVLQASHVDCVLSHCLFTLHHRWVVASGNVIVGGLCCPAWHVSWPRSLLNGQQAQFGWACRWLMSGPLHWRRSRCVHKQRHELSCHFNVSDQESNCIVSAKNHCFGLSLLFLFSSNLAY